MKPTISGSNAFGVGPNESPSDRYPPRVAESKAQRPESDSSIGHLSTGDLALRRGGIEVGVKDPKLGRLLLNSDCAAKAHGFITRCRNVVSERVREHFGEMHGCPLHHRGVEIVRTHIDVDHPLNNNRIAAGIITPALSKEGAAVCNGHLADPVSTREALCQNMIHNRRIACGAIGIVPLFPDSAP